MQRCLWKVMAIAGFWLLASSAFAAEAAPSLAPVAAATALPTAAITAAPASENVTELMLFQEVPQVVTASKKSESILTAPGTVYVITSEEMKKYGWNNAAEAIRMIPSLDTCNFYEDLRVGARGFATSGSKVALLIDGREANDLEFNDPCCYWTTLNANQIERIEVVMGPNSTLYGPNVMEAVINIITKFGGDKAADISETGVGFATSNMQDAYMTYRKNSADGHIGFAAHYYDNAQNWSELSSFVGDTNAYSRDKVRDPVRDKNPSDFLNEDKMCALLGDVKYKDFYGGFDLKQWTNNYGIEFVKYDDTRDVREMPQQAYFAGVKHSFGDDLEAMVEYRHISQSHLWHHTGATNPAATDYNDLGLYVYTDGMRNVTFDKVIAQVDYKLYAGNKLTVGGEWKELNFPFFDTESDLVPVTVSSSWQTAADEGRTKTAGLSIFAQDSVTLIENMLMAYLGVQYYKETFTEAKYSPRGSLIYQPTKESSVKLTYGEGFVGPNVFDTLARNYAGSQEMKMLDLNYSLNVNLGKVSIYNSCSLYDMRLQDASILYWVTPVLTAYYTKDLEILGVEDQVKVKYDKLSGIVGFRVADNKTQDPAPDPSQRIKVGATYDILDNLSAGVFADHANEVREVVFDTDGTTLITQTIPAWTAVSFNITNEFKLDNMKLALGLYVENIFDTAYYAPDVSASSPVEYLQTPRTYRLTLSTKF